MADDPDDAGGATGAGGVGPPDEPRGADATSADGGEGGGDRDDDRDRDADVRERVAAGDLNGALRLLMTRYGDAVYRFIRKELRDDVWAEDVHQRVFMEAHRDLPRFRGDSAHRTWLFAIARNRVLDAIKKSNREQQHLEDTEGADMADPRLSPGELLDDARLAATLAGCLEKLDAVIRTAVLLRFQQGFTYEEMAEICGDKAGTLQARVSRALPVLRECIERTTGGKV